MKIFSVDDSFCMDRNRVYQLLGNLMFKVSCFVDTQRQQEILEEEERQEIQKLANIKLYLFQTSAFLAQQLGRQLNF